MRRQFALATALVACLTLVFLAALACSDEPTEPTLPEITVVMDAGEEDGTCEETSGQYGDESYICDTAEAAEHLAGDYEDQFGYTCYTSGALVWCYHESD